MLTPELDRLERVRKRKYLNIAAIPASIFLLIAAGKLSMDLMLKYHNELPKPCGDFPAGCVVTPLLNHSIEVRVGDELVILNPSDKLTILVEYDVNGEQYLATYERNGKLVPVLVNVSDVEKWH